MLVAAVVVTPIGGMGAAHAFAQPASLLAGVGVGISSSVVPYVTDQLAMVRLDRATYSLMVSLLPAIATVVGVVVLAQVPTLAQAAGVALVVCGVAVHRERDAGAQNAANARKLPSREPQVGVSSPNAVVPEISPRN